jgi:putative SOS response-associated peptidase YedK
MFVLPQAMRIERHHHLALRVLEDAVARASCGGVARTWGHRLALDLLVRSGVAEAWQASAFWDALAMQWERHQFDHNARYEQVTLLQSCVTNWSHRLDIEPLDPVQMRRLERPYLPDLAIDAGTQQLPCMCNRYTPGDRQMIRSLFGARELRSANDGPSIVHPKDPGWVVRLVEGERVLEQMTWGFPVYLRGKSGQPLKAKPVNNARFDKLGGFWQRWAEAPAHRCLIPTAAYAEAVGPAGSMTTTWLSVKGTPISAWAGLWRESDEWGTCYTGVMTDNAPELADIHDRSPVILNPDDWDTWLHAPLPDLKPFDRPYPADRMTIDRTSVLWKNGGSALPPSLSSL